MNNKPIKKEFISNKINMENLIDKKNMLFNKLVIAKDSLDLNSFYFNNIIHFFLYKIIAFHEKNLLNY
jgi:glycerol-3-phosphate O-acyltransferase